MTKELVQLRGLRSTLGCYQVQDIRLDSALLAADSCQSLGVDTQAHRLRTQCLHQVDLRRLQVQCYRGLRSILLVQYMRYR